MAAAARAAECGSGSGSSMTTSRLAGRSGGESFGKRTHDCNDAQTERCRWAKRCDCRGTALCGLRVFHQPETGVLLAEADDLFGTQLREAGTGDRSSERFLPFPGWTLPNVMGAGGLQAMVKCGLPIRGKRVIVAGTGPLLLAVAAYLRQHGAEIAVICEQASWASLAAVRHGAACTARQDSFRDSS